MFAKVKTLLSEGADVLLELVLLSVFDLQTRVGLLHEAETACSSSRGDDLLLI